MRKQLHGIWVTELRCPDGAVAVVADHGAHLLSWTPAAGGPALYLSERSQYGGSSAIRGGVPVIFPQFGERGTGKRHGFARVQTWRPGFAGIEHGRAVARYRLGNEDVADNVWPHRFELEMEIAFAAQELQLSLTVHNPSDEAWEFCAALHTYLHVQDHARLDIDGLQHAGFIDQTRGGITTIPEERSLRIAQEIDRIYPAVKNAIVLSDDERVVTVEKHGFSDIVVWNPGAEKAGQLADMPGDDYRTFVCIEAGEIAKPVLLGPGGRWVGRQQIAVAPRQNQ